jgi:hypothetical protein
LRGKGFGSRRAKDARDRCRHANTGLVLGETVSDPIILEHYRKIVSRQDCTKALSQTLPETVGI